MANRHFNSGVTKRDLVLNYSNEVKQLSEAGFASRTIAEVLKKEFGLDVSYQVVLYCLKHTEKREERPFESLMRHFDEIKQLCSKGYSAKAVFEHLSKNGNIKGLTYSRTLKFLKNNETSLGWVNNRKA